MIAGLTTAAKRDLAHARVLAASWKRAFPEAPFFAILIDDHERYLDFRDESFTLIGYRDLGVPHVEWMAFSLPESAFADALLAWALPAIVDRGAPQVCYLPQASTRELLPSPEQHRELLSRWRRGDGSGLVSWTLSVDAQRRATQIERWQARVQELVPQCQSVDWHEVAAILGLDIHDAGQMGLQSEHELLRSGMRTASKWPYSHAGWPNGEPIHDLYRGVLRHRPEWLANSLNPLSDAGREHVLAFWQEPVKGVPRLVYELYERRPDLHAALGDPRDQRAVDLMAWAMERGVEEHRLPEWWKRPWFAAREALRQPVWPTEEAILLLDQRPDVRALDEERQLRWLLTAGLVEYALSPGTLVAADRRWRELLASAGGLARAWKQIAFGRSLLAARRQPLQPRPVVALFPAPIAPPPQPVPPVAPAPRAMVIDRSPRPFGVNLVGYAYAEMGVGESVRLTAMALEAAGVPYALCALQGAASHRQEDRRLGEPAREFPYAVNLFQVPADRLDDAWREASGRLPRETYTIGYWAWELESIPTSHVAASAALDEVWGPSTFVRDAYARVLQRPVITMPHPVSRPPSTLLTREALGLPRDPFLLLTAFDAASVMERKNPRDSLLLLRRLIKGYPNLHLVLKASSSHLAREEMEELRALSDGLPVTLVERTLSRQEMYGLVELCDAFLSLHRSEGFGLVIAEAMAASKPVVATSYSGNVDFMTEANSYLVTFDRRLVGHGSLPYDPSATWAAPSLDHAEQQVRRLLTDVAERDRRRHAAQQTIDQQLSIEVVGGQMLTRLSQITQGLR